MSKNTDNNDVPLSNIVDYKNKTHLTEDQVKSLRSGGGNGGDMEVRIAKLEASVEHIQSDIGEMKLDVRGIRSELGDLRSSQMDKLTRIEAILSSKIDYKWFITSFLALMFFMLSREIFALFTLF